VVGQPGMTKKEIKKKGQKKKKKKKLKLELKLNWSCWSFGIFHDQNENIRQHFSLQSVKSFKLVRNHDLTLLQLIQLLLDKVKLQELQSVHLCLTSS
jgi:hypothetical protein